MPLDRPTAALCAVLLTSVACDAEPTEPAPTPAPLDASTRESAPPPVPPPTAPPRPPAVEADVPPAAPPPADTAVDPTLRQAKRAMMLYDAPDFRAAFRGKIARGESFHSYEVVPGDPECRGEWARVGTSAYACLHRSVEVEEPPPRPLPVLGGNGLTPFYYVRRRNPETPAPLWRSRAALRRGADPVGALDLDHDYAFVTRRRSRGGRVLSDAARRTVREADVRRLKPSAFEGRDLITTPLPDSGQLAWVVRWPHAPRFDTTDTTKAPSGSLAFQTMVVVDDAPQMKRGVRVFPLTDGTGWVEAKAIRRYRPTSLPVPDDVEDRTVWLDVELGQQTLAIMRGATPQFVTVVSSGSGQHPTPPGLYRIESKQAFGDMRSRPSDDDPYYVEAVPWVMYFEGRFALHGAFWHNRFGNRVSHGCINLAPKDAARVFDSLEPKLPPGWLTVYEHADDLGTLVRIRKGDAPVPDRRRANPRRRTAG
ncbi:MAG: L,D-transpeptidase [Myxococcota bacterium]